MNDVPASPRSKRRAPAGCACSPSCRCGDYLPLQEGLLRFGLHLLVLSSEPRAFSHARSSGARSAFSNSKPRCPKE